MADEIDVSVLTDFIDAARTLRATTQINDGNVEQTKKLLERIKSDAEKLNKMSFDNLRKKAEDALKQLNPPPKFNEGTNRVAEINKLTVNDNGAAITTPNNDAAKPSETKGTTELQLSQFFNDVSTSLIDAQKELNQSSLEYIRTLDQHFPPAYYSIPNLKAEMKVGFSKIKDKGLNLILFSSREQKQEYGESTVTFEVVGSPPPPGDVVVPMPRFLVMGKKRDELITKIIAAKNLTQKPLINTKGNATIFRYEKKDEDKRTKYLVIWPGQKQGTFSEESWHSMTVIYLEEFEENGELKLEFPKDKETSAATIESIFEFPPPDQMLNIPPNKADKLKDVLGSEIKVAEMVINLGDVLMNINLLLNQWLDFALKPQPPDKT